VLGTEVAGEVVAVGKDVTAFQPGDAVFGIDSSSIGAYAEYASRPAKLLAIKPANLSYEEAAALPFGAGTALYFLRDKARIQPGQKVLVHGASGGVGNYAVQLAKYFGAEVTGVSSGKNAELVKSLGADHFIDYTSEDFTQGGAIYDVIFDSVPGKLSFDRAKQALKPAGLYLAVAGGPREMLWALTHSLCGGQKVITGSPAESQEDLVFLKELAEAGKLKVVIDRCYPLEEAADAHRYVDSGRKRGNVVLTVAQPS
jgi:NADPH2:quinone reductase